MAKRLQNELAEFSRNSTSYPKVTLPEDTLHKWKVQILGPDKTPYEKGIFNLEIEIPVEYPFKPPKLKFTTKVYHPNVKSDGMICHSELRELWSPQRKISDILNIVKNLLETPNPDDPLEPEIAAVYKNDKNKFNKTAKEWTSKYAK